MNVIVDVDADFHTEEGDPTWSETNYFGFYNAEHHLNVGVYALFRPNVGSVVSTISMNSGRSVTPWESDFSDLRSSLAMPESGSLRDYHLANSLHVRCTDPNRSWTIGYDDGEGTTIDVVWDALMPGFDIQDPEMDPMCASGTEEGKFSWGTSYDGHFDQTGRVQGTVSVRGRAYDIDCVSTMDHSWGSRPERGKPNLSWLHAHFSTDLAVHAIFGFDENTGGNDLWLAHGYVLDHGRVYGLKAASGRTERVQERYAESVELELTDRDDRTFHLTGRALTTYPWQCWPNMVAFNVLADWTLAGHDGNGTGEIMDFFEVPSLTRLNSDPATARPSRPRA